MRAIESTSESTSHYATVTECDCVLFVVHFCVVHNSAVFTYPLVSTIVTVELMSFITGDQ